MPNWRDTSCGSQFVPATAIGLAADARSARVSQAPLGSRLSVGRAPSPVVFDLGVDLRRSAQLKVLSQKRRVGAPAPHNTSHYSSSSFTSPRAALAFSTIF